MWEGGAWGSHASSQINLGIVFMPVYLPTIHSLKSCAAPGATVLTPSMADASLFGICGLLKRILEADASIPPGLSLPTWQLMHGKPHSPHDPIILVNSPSPSEILLKHLLLLAAFPTPIQLGTYSSLLVCETVALFTEPLEATLGDCALIANVPPCPQGPHSDTGSQSLSIPRCSWFSGGNVDK